ncbi:MAG: Iron-sulfur cluster carrier protein [Alphaproteobacteria bacterium MarineAlpha6_Bin4]|nr:MAG: Iron-sulfur cluster carrier protein [Alphaproteobacteria bacterium MarineAlpha6_Bin3]PPR38476.1 MAG: Iron-sulfur cluster carrier protein [Alphaproteobacteria bacterium MarineAlpha6_Bin4]|tara:strand:+ start:8311 stop:9081 length:771 start_codon:yes stop_codon:yes gene_type:complete
MNGIYHLDGVKKVILVASAKGGVGKSTTAINLATAFNQLHHNVGILDADIYGPSMPKMLGITKKPSISEDKRFIPIDKYNMKCMSIGFLIDQQTPVIWRGPMIIKALKQMLNGVVWNGVDTLIIDLPPGTGDVQLTLCQKLKISGVVIVSTPQELALIDAIKGINMFKKLNVPILGIIENMSYLKTKSGEVIDIFGKGAVEKSAKENSISFLGEIPIDKSISVNSDKGVPYLIENNETNTGKKIIEIAKIIEKKIK